ncbi:hypothetical protein [Comamonas testosteroni]|uniref:hypothetical protein n=1 Tax=Comamonas testosteroni TaxID=285 RepID=UPI0028EF4DCC|nr:hypothetical protein [Comamonas testosteroni]
MAMIADAVAAADLLGMRVFKISALCPSDPTEGRAELTVNTTSKLQNVPGKKPGAFAELGMVIDTLLADGKTHRLFEIEVDGAYVFSKKIDAKVLKDERFIHMLCRPLYATAVFEFRKLSAAMDLGEVYVTTEMPWPDGLPRVLDDSDIPVPTKRVSKSSKNSK